MVIATLAAPNEAVRAAAIATFAVVSGWSAGYYYLLMCRSSRLATVLDAGVLVLLSLSAQWLVSPSWLSTGKSWLLPFVSFAAVAYQYYTGVLLGGLVAVATTAGMIVGTVIALPAGSSSDSVVTACWSLALAALARVLWTVVQEGGVRADKATAEADEERRTSRVRAAARAANRALVDSLHDHAASTLLWAGSGQGGDLIPAMARRDLEVLAADGKQPWAEADLMQLLGVAVELVPLTVDLQGPEQLPLPGPVAGAFAGAAQQALTNADRHAQVDAVEVRVTSAAGQVGVRVVDHGIGFDFDRLDDMRRGLRASIVERMAAIGGGARISSNPGRGTVVELWWEHV